LILQELSSVLFAPFILYYSLSESAPKILDFFREYTVNVPNLGYVCSFAVFDFKKNGNVQYGAGADNTAKVSNQGKMEHSFMNFKANYPTWDPGFQGSEYIKNIGKKSLEASEMLQSVAMGHARRMHPRNFDGQESVMDSFIKGESNYHPENVGREFVALLDAIYDANRRNL
jgi:Autophagy protein ATG9